MIFCAVSKVINSELGKLNFFKKCLFEKIKVFNDS